MAVVPEVVPEAVAGAAALGVPVRATLRDRARAAVEVRALSAQLVVRLLLATAGGLALFAGFAPLGWWWTPIAGTCLLALAVRGETVPRSYLIGLAGTLAFLLPLLSWSRVAGLDAWLILVTSQSLIGALIGPLLALAQRAPAWPLTTAAAWVAVEALRGREPFGGFPWGRLAFSQGHTPFTPFAAVGGAPLVTFAVAFCGGLLAAALLVPRTTARAGAALAVGALPVTGLLVRPAPPAPGRSVVVGVVQGDVPRMGLEAMAQRRVVLDNHVARTLQLAQQVAARQVPAPDLVIWPENSSDLDPLALPEAAGRITTAAEAIRRPILVGAVLEGPRPGTLRNAGLVWSGDHPTGQMYVKRHPVPFGEYLPFRSFFTSFVGRFATLMPDDFVPGSKPGVLPIATPAGTVTVGDVICFEVAYDSIVRDVVGNGDTSGGLLIVQTNNATFGRSAESRQQLAMVQLRAVEHDRSAVMASTTGVSAIVRADGSIAASTPLFTPAALVQRVPLSTARTLADRLGEVPEWTVVAVAAAGVAVGAVRRRAS